MDSIHQAADDVVSEEVPTRRLVKVRRLKKKAELSI